MTAGVDPPRRHPGHAIRSVTVVAAALLAVGAGVGGPATSAPAPRSRAVGPGPRAVAAGQRQPRAVAAGQRQISWLAAGDSYSSGEGLVHSTGPCARAGVGSGSSTWAQVAYSQLRDRGSPLSQPDLVACTGAVTRDMIDARDGQGRPEWSPSMGRFDLVSFTFGGDDVGFGPVMEQCIGLSRLLDTIRNSSAGALSGSHVAPLPSDPGHLCPSASVIERRISALSAAYRSFLTDVADRVVEPGGNIVVLGYPALVEAPASWSAWERAVGSCWGIRAADATELRGLAADLDATIGAAAAAVNARAPHRVHITYVDVNTGNGPTPPGDADLFDPRTGARHNLCGADPWINGWSGVGLGAGSFHPEQQGLDAEGTLAAAFIGRLDWTRVT